MSYRNDFYRLLFFVLTAAFCFGPTGCKRQTPAPFPQYSATAEQNDYTVSTDPNWPHPRSDERIDQRRRMVNHIRDFYRLEDPKTLNALLQVPRHWFVPEARQRLAYADFPLPIGHGQTISQPYIVAYMTHLLELDAGKKVLEIGTGSGYQAAILTELTPHVYSIEIVEPLAKTADERLKTLGYKTVKVKAGDGYKGWPEHQPFDAIIVTCAPDNVPPALIRQLKPNGKMVIPVGDTFGVQDLILLTKDKKGKLTRKSMMPVRFVPMVHESPK